MAATTASARITFMDLDICDEDFASTEEACDSLTWGYDVVAERIGSANGWPVCRFHGNEEALDVVFARYNA